MGHPSEQLDMGPAARIVEQFFQSSSAPAGRLAGDSLIPLLQQIQEAYGYLPQQVLEWVSGKTAIPTSRMYGVATFYAQFYLQPHGKHTVRCCRGTACHVRGGKKIISTVKGVLGLEEGETKEDMSFSFETVACLGACALAPVTVVDTTYYGKMTPRRAEQILHTLSKDRP
jgi:NADH-quinone oxidoreductase subunit E